MHLLPWLTLLLLHVTAVWCGSEYQEHLHVQPLTSSDLLASFHFRTTTSQEAFEKQRFRFFPRSLGQILLHSSTPELHLRFSYGRWNTEDWGERPWNGTKEGGIGVDLWAWVEGANRTEIDKRWSTLTNSLSGLFCASLNFVDSTRTSRPKWFGRHPTTPEQASSRENAQLLYGALPREVVCTENMTPLLKMLPCKGKAGIASLLNGHRPFDASWQIMAFDVTRSCAKEKEDCSVQLDITLDIVFDIERAKRQSHDDPIPRPPPIEHIRCDTSRSDESKEHCFPVDNYRLPGWTLHEIFGKSIQGNCPADETGEAPFCLRVAEDAVINTSREPRKDKQPSTRDLRCYDLELEKPFDLTFLHEQQLDKVSPPSPPKLLISRSLNGQGQAQGSIEVLIENLDEKPLTVKYMETIPWFLRIYMHTLEVQERGSSKKSRLLKKTYYMPHIDRERGSLIELEIDLPPKSPVSITYDVEKALLRYTEYPPDANRGFDVPASVVSYHDLEGGYHEVRTTPLLVALPTPDFSMPYNVIILTSTVIALAFGSIFNPLVRRFVPADEVESFGLGSLKLLVLARVEKVRRKFTAKPKVE